MARQNGMRREGVRKEAALGPEPIPDKLYFRIGEVARICAVPSYVLRFWEREFPQLHPGKGGTGQRLYRRSDVEMALRVRRLLYEEGYTIPGARQWLRDGSRAKATPGGMAEGAEGDLVGASGLRAMRLREMRTELEEIAELLRGPELLRTSAAGERKRHPVRRRSLNEGAMPLFPLLEGSGTTERAKGSEGDER